MSNPTSRFTNWQMPEFNENGMTKWQWMCQYREGLRLSRNTDIGAFTYLNAKNGVTIEENVQIGSHCAIYSQSTIDDKNGPVVIREGAKIGSHTTIMPNVTIGKNSVVGAHSFVKEDAPDNSTVFGVPARVIFERK